jgi:hypothetical protein
MGKKLVKSSKLIGGNQNRQTLTRPQKQDSSTMNRPKKYPTELGSTTSGEIFDFSKDENNQWLILGENI